MNKILGIICSVIGGILIELIFFYIWSAFEDETHLIIGASCALGGVLVYISLMRFLILKGNQQKKGIDIKGKIKPVLYTFIVGVSIIVTALVLFAKDKKDYKEQYKRQEQLQHLDQVYDQIDKENELATKAKTILEQAKSHHDEATILAEYISAIDYSSTSDMNAREWRAYIDICNLSVYFYDIEQAKIYYNEKDYDNCIKFSETAIKRFQEAKDAYIGNRGSLDKYR